MLPPERAAVLGVPIALVRKLAAQPYHRPARHRFALAPSRLLGNPGVRFMRPLARRTPKGASWRIRLIEDLRDLVTEETPEDYLTVYQTMRSLPVSRHTVSQPVKR
jgi:hypothetical protein